MFSLFCAWITYVLSRALPLPLHGARICSVERESKRVPYVVKEGQNVEDVRAAAEWIARALSSSGYAADFSPASLWEIDRFFSEHAAEGRAVRGGLLSSDLGSRLFAVGAYVGEVIRRSLGGEWRGDDSNPQAEIDVELVVGETTCWPVQRVMKRFTHGAEDGIASYGAGLGLAVGAKPPIVKRRQWWKVW